MSLVVLTKLQNGWRVLWECADDAVHLRISQINV